MGLDIFFESDIRNALLAANEASAATAAVVAEVDKGDNELLLVTLRAYREGYKAALATVALAFGIAPMAVVPTKQTESLDAGASTSPLHHKEDTLSQGRDKRESRLSPGV